MKKLSLLIILLLVLFYSNAQDTPLIGGQAFGEIKNPLAWEGSIKKTSICKRIGARFFIQF